MNCYKVIAKCGHVGKGHYIIKEFYVMAGDGKEAALKVRWFPRVKHHWKNAIEKVCKITKEEYDLGLLKTQQDMYFHVRNSTEQRIYVSMDLDEVYEREVPEKKRRNKSFVYYVRMEKIRDRDFKIQLAEVI